MKKHFAFLFAATLLGLSAFAQTTYPTKPVKLMVGAGAANHGIQLVACHEFKQGTPKGQNDTAMPMLSVHATSTQLHHALAHESQTG
jgi:hypothetical protein